jgi:lysophospholipase L1-like esterase
MPVVIRHDDSRLGWPGAVSLERTKDWTMPWRIPEDERGLFHAELVARAAEPSGVRIAFKSDTTFLAGAVEPHPALLKVELVCDARSVGSVSLAGKKAFRFKGLAKGKKRMELWLPQFGEFRLRGLELSDGATLEPLEDTRPRWIAYGSSITQCGEADLPTGTWPAIVAREHGLNLTSLGFGGQCHLDPMIALTMRDLPADFLSMCVGINVMGHATMSARTFGSGIIGFVKIVREKHPATPLAVMSAIYAPDFETTPNALGLTLAMTRPEVKTAVDALAACGDRNVHYVDGLDIFGPDAAHLLPDRLHPNTEGYRHLAANFLEKVARKLFV